MEGEEKQVWRVVRHGVPATFGPEMNVTTYSHDGWWLVDVPVGRPIQGRTPLAAVCGYIASRFIEATEIIPPGQMSRAELLAAVETVRAQGEATTRKLHEDRAAIVAELDHERAISTVNCGACAALPAGSPCAHCDGTRLVPAVAEVDRLREAQGEAVETLMRLAHAQQRLAAGQGGEQGERAYAKAAAYDHAARIIVEEMGAVARPTPCALAP